MKVIAGLGNPGREYESTPHSIGFEVADAVVSAMGAAFRNSPSFRGMVADGRFANGKVLVVKPMTFMNLSGDCVAPVVKYHNATPADLLVIQDDIDLAVGKMRIRKAGSCGGHNGIRNIIERIGTQAFTRLKIGVGKDSANVIGHVLGKFDPVTRKTIDLVVAEAVKAAEAVLRDGPDKAMNAYNGYNAQV